MECTLGFWQKYLVNHPGAQADGEIPDVPAPPSPVCGQNRKRNRKKKVTAGQDDLGQSRSSRASKSGSSLSWADMEVDEEPEPAPAVGGDAQGDLSKMGKDILELDKKVDGVHKLLAEGDW